MFKLYHGQEPYLTRRVAREEFMRLKKEYPEYETSIIDCQTADQQNIIETYQSQGLFSNGKILYFKRLYTRKDKADILDDLLERMLEESDDFHIIFSEEQKIPSNTKYFKSFKANKNDFETKKLNKRTFMTFAKAEVAKTDINIANDALFTLCQQCNYTPEKLVNELNKLKLSGKTDISTEDVQELTADTLESDIWGFIDAINGKSNRMSIEILEDLFKQRVEPIFILSMIVRNTRLILLTKCLVDEGQGSKEIAKELKVPPFTVPSLINSANQMSYDKIAFIYDKLANLDYQIKTGQIEPKLGLTLLTTIL